MTAPFKLTEGFAVRDATFADLPEILKIYNSTIASREATADLAPVGLEDRRAWFDEHNPERRPLWVLESTNPADSRLVGWLSFSDFHHRSAYRYTVELGIYLASDSRGHGYGSKLLQRAIQFAPQIEAKTLVGLIFGHNVRSLSLFHSQGFERWALLPRIASMDGIERDLVIVGRQID